MSKLFSVVFVVLAIFLSGCTIVSKAPRTVTFVAPTGVTYDVFIKVSPGGYGTAEWQSFTSLTGTQTLTYQSEMQFDSGNWFSNDFRVESEGYRTQRGDLYVDYLSGDGHAQFYDRVNLTFIRDVDTEINWWRDYDIGGYRWRAELNFTMGYDLPLIGGSVAFEDIISPSKVTFEYSGSCEVYGDDYRFSGTIDVGVWSAYPSPTVLSNNTNPYNNTSARCGISVTPIAVDGNLIETKIW